jgi:23S rRNA pseudouridine1911/1915/1917 synthase
VYGRSTSLATFSLVSAVLHTGRTHQIRVHFAWLKHPVVGDIVYGFRTPRLGLNRQFLHAHRLRLRLPATGAEQEFVAPLPAELAAVLASLHAAS